MMTSLSRVSKEEEHVTIEKYDQLYVCSFIDLITFPLSMLLSDHKFKPGKFLPFL